MLEKLKLPELEAESNQTQFLLAEQPPWVVKIEHLHGAQVSKQACSRQVGRGGQRRESMPWLRWPARAFSRRKEPIGGQPHSAGSRGTCALATPHHGTVWQRAVACAPLRNAAAMYMYMAMYTHMYVDCGYICMWGLVAACHARWS